jgi:putative transposase
LTVLRLDRPPTLARTLRSTNAIESMISIAREHAKNVKRWRDATMALRWRRRHDRSPAAVSPLNGRLHLPILCAALERETSKTAGLICHDEEVNAA